MALGVGDRNDHTDRKMAHSPWRLAWRTCWTIPVYLYRLAISPLLPRGCIYHPTCSRYAIDALMRFGPLRGGLVAFMRIGRCIAARFRGGADPLPDRWSWQAEMETIVVDDCAGDDYAPACPNRWDGAKPDIGALVMWRFRPIF